MGIMQSGSESSPQTQGYQPHICFIYLFRPSSLPHADAESLDALATYVWGLVGYDQQQHKLSFD